MKPCKKVYDLLSQGFCCKERLLLLRLYEAQHSQGRERYGKERLVLSSVDEKHLKFRKARVGPWPNGKVCIPWLRSQVSFPVLGGKIKYLNRIAFGARVVTKLGEGTCPQVWQTNTIHGLYVVEEENQLPHIIFWLNLAYDFKGLELMMAEGRNSWELRSIATRQRAFHQWHPIPPNPSQIV